MNVPVQAMRAQQWEDVVTSLPSVLLGNCVLLWVDEAAETVKEIQELPGVQG